MNGGRLSAAEEKGKQKAADADADQDLPLPPAAALVLKSADNRYRCTGGQLVRRRPAGDAAAAANWPYPYTGGAGVPLPRHLLLVPPSGGTSEIEEEEEEAPPSPPLPPSSRRRRRLAPLSAEGATAVLAAVARLEGVVKEIQAALDSQLGGLEEARRRRGAAEVQLLQNKLATLQAKVGGIKDAMLAFRRHAERKTK